MRYPVSLLCFLVLPLFFFSSVSFSIEEEIVFELKREKTKKQNSTTRKKTTPKKFKRKSFSYSKEFLIFNEKPKSNFKGGMTLKVNIPYPLIASFTEEFPVYGVVTYPFKGVISGKIKGVKNTNKALVSFEEVIVNNEVQNIKSFPVFLTGNLKENILKDVALNFFESFPSILALALRTQIPQSQIHFVNTDLQNKLGKLPTLEAEKRKRLGYLELKTINLLKIVIK